MLITQSSIITYNKIEATDLVLEFNRTPLHVSEIIRDKRQYPKIYVLTIDLTFGNSRPKPKKAGYHYHQLRFNNPDTKRINHPARP